MILESVVCVVLHCSRCNVAFRDDSDDDYSGTAHWDNPEAIAEQFNNEHNEYGGWRRFDDRYVCSDCQVSHGDSAGFADDPNAREAEEPLPALEADKVTRTQAGYLRDSRHVVQFDTDGWTIKHPLLCRPNLFDCPVNAAAKRGVRKPPEGLGRYFCDVEDEWFVVGAAIGDGAA